MKLSISKPPESLIKLNSLISTLTRNHQSSQALQLFDQIHSSHHLRPDQYTLASTLTACAALNDDGAGKQLHGYIIRAGFQNYTHISNTLLSLYAKSSDLESVSRVFDGIRCPDVYSWTTILSAYTKTGCFDVAFHMFDEIPQRDVAMWNAMITGCAVHGCEGTALEMFVEMHRLGVRCDSFSFASALSLCSSPAMLALGRQVHSLLLKTALVVIRVSVINALLTMYFNCGRVQDACDVFEEAMMHNEITFNAMIGGLVKWGRLLEAMVMLVEMQGAGFRPTGLTFVSLLSACSSPKMAKLGVQVHGQVIKLGFETCTWVSNAAMDMYAKHGDLISARLIFNGLEEKDLVSWNSMIASYAQGNCHESAIHLFLEMQKAEVEPDEFTIGGLLACLECGDIAGMLLALVAKNGLITNTQVGNALIGALQKNGNITEAYQLFCGMPAKNLISWNSIISGCVSNVFVKMGLELFSKMLVSKIMPNAFTLSLVLSTCASISALRHGQQVHAYILRSGMDSETSLANALISLYAKCGVLNCASNIFIGMDTRDTISWNSMIAGYAQNGKEQEAICCFEAMKEIGEEPPDSATLTIVLSACSHAGLVDYAQKAFSFMCKDCGIEPTEEHYSCLMDLLGRAGSLDDAEKLISSMPVRADARVWWVLLSACREQGNVRLGKIAARFLLEIEPENPAVYVLLSNIYAATGLWVEAGQVREVMRKNGVTKKPGCSWTVLESHS